MRKSLVWGILAAVSVSLILTIFLLNPFEESKVSELEYKTYVNENYGFMFDFPANWSFSSSKNTEISRAENNSAIIGNPSGNNFPFAGVFVAKENVSENERVRVVQLTVRKTHSSFSLENFLESEGIQIGGESWETSGPVNIVIDGGNAFKYVLRGPPLAMSTRTRIEVIFAKKDNYLYWFNLIGKETSYYKSVFEHVINSFSFLEQ